MNVYNINQSDTRSKIQYLDSIIPTKSSSDEVDSDTETECLSPYGHRTNFFNKPNELKNTHLEHTILYNPKTLGEQSDIKLRHQKIENIIKALIDPDSDSEDESVTTMAPQQKITEEQPEILPKCTQTNSNICHNLQRSYSLKFTETLTTPSQDELSINDTTTLIKNLYRDLYGRTDSFGKDLANKINVSLNTFGLPGIEKLNNSKSNYHDLVAGWLDWLSQTDPKLIAYILPFSQEIQFTTAATIHQELEKQGITPPLDIQRFLFNITTNHSNIEACIPYTINIPQEGTSLYLTVKYDISTAGQAIDIKIIINRTNKAIFSLGIQWANLKSKTKTFFDNIKTFFYRQFISTKSKETPTEYFQWMGEDSMLNMDITQIINQGTQILKFSDENSNISLDGSERLLQENLDRTIQALGYKLSTHPDTFHYNGIELLCDLQHKIHTNIRYKDTELIDFIPFIDFIKCDFSGLSTNTTIHIILQQLLYIMRNNDLYMARNQAAEFGILMRMHLNNNKEIQRQLLDLAETLYESCPNEYQSITRTGQISYNGLRKSMVTWFIDGVSNLT